MNVTWKSKLLCVLYAHVLDHHRTGFCGLGTRFEQIVLNLDLKCFVGTWMHASHDCTRVPATALCVLCVKPARIPGNLPRERRAGRRCSVVRHSGRSTNCERTYRKGARNHHSACKRYVFSSECSC